MRIFQVEADTETGEWIEGTLREVGDAPRDAFLTHQDTGEAHYDTFEHEGETCGIEVRWVRD